MKRGSKRKPKHNLAVYECTHQRVNELATGLGMSVADYFEQHLSRVLESQWRKMLADKLAAQGGK